MPPARPGARLRPDAAAALPTLSADGRTYTFRIRPGSALLAAVGRPLDAPTVPAHDRARAVPEGWARLERRCTSRRHRRRTRVPAPAMHAHVAASSPAATSCRSRSPAGRRPALAAGACRSSARCPPDTPAPATPRADRRRRAPTTSARRRRPDGARPQPQLPRHRARAEPARIVYLTGVPTARGGGAGRRRRRSTSCPGTSTCTARWRPAARSTGASGTSRQPRGATAAALPRGAAPGVDMIAFNTRRRCSRPAAAPRRQLRARPARRSPRVFDEAPTDRYVPPAVPGGARGTASIRSTARPRDRAQPARRARTAARAAVLLRRPRRTCGSPQLVRANLRADRHRRLDRPVARTACAGRDPKAGRADMLLVTRADAELDPAPFLDGAVGRDAAFGRGARAADVRRPRVPRRGSTQRRALTRRARLAAYARDRGRRAARRRAVRGVRRRSPQPEYLSARGRLPA